MNFGTDFTGLKRFYYIYKVFTKQKKVSNVILFTEGINHQATVNHADCNLL